jgi:lysophospholipase L1-like esterase
MQSIQTAPITSGYGLTKFRVRMRRTFFRLILIVLGIGVGLVISEMIMRAFHLGHTRSVILYNNKIFKLPPHASFMNLDENTNLMETNNLGFHDRERQAANDNYRILFMGDSFVEGRQVDTQSLFTMRLEKKFADGGQKIEAINGGVPGTGTAYQYSLWKEFFEPSVKVDHLVLCFFMGNDLLDNSAELKLSTFGETDNSFFLGSEGNILATRTQPGLVKSTINYVRDRSVLMDRLYETAYRMKKDAQAGSGGGAGDDGGRVDRSGAWRDSEQGTIALIKRWRSELNAKKIPFDVVVIDRPGKVYNKFELEFADRLLTTCTAEGIDCLRLKLTEDPFESYSFDGANLGHFNYKGHELSANELYEYFKSHHAALFNRTSEEHKSN